MRLNGLLAAALLTTLACATDNEAAQRRAATPAPAATQKPAPAGTQTAGTSGTAVNGSAAVLADFKARIDTYLELRKRAAKDSQALKETEDPARIRAAQDEQAARIRAMRADAKPGDIFTPQIRTEFRRLLYPETQGEDGRDAKEVLKEDAPASVPLKVNTKYPEGAPLPTVPANFLLNLPTLPKPLEYRIINKHLILLDGDANLIVDYMTNVIR